MQKQQIRENKMKKGLLALSAATLFVMTTPVQAKQEICVFDLLGKAGESYKLVEEWKLASKTWQADVELIPYQDEEKAEKEPVKKVLERKNRCQQEYVLATAI